MIDLPEKYLGVWEKAAPLLKKGRPDDLQHSIEVATLVLNYDGEMDIDKDVLVPVAIMHDIGHSAILPEDFRFITGLDKLSNGKLVHMLAGAKIARDILESSGYDPEKSKEIIDIIRVHDADQLKGIDLNKFYDTENKRVFHDLDSLDRYTMQRFNEFMKIKPDKEKLLETLRGFLDNFFYPQFRKIAEERMKILES